MYEIMLLIIVYLSLEIVLIIVTQNRVSNNQYTICTKRSHLSETFDFNSGLNKTSTPHSNLLII